MRKNLQMIKTAWRYSRRYGGRLDALTLFPAIMLWVMTCYEEVKDES